MSKLSEMMDNLGPARDEDGHPITQNQWDELRKQLEQSHADIAGLHDQLEEPQIAQDDYRLNKLELEQLRQQLADSQQARLAEARELSGLILCHAEPVAWQHEDDTGCLIPAENKGCEDSGYSIALYRAKEQ